MYKNFVMKLYRLHEVQNLPISMEKAWHFLSDPKNLKTITPDYMGFEILGGDEKNVSRTDHQVHCHPVMGIPTQWVTEITMSRKGNILLTNKGLALMPYGITNILSDHRKWIGWKILLTIKYLLEYWDKWFIE